MNTQIDQNDTEDNTPIEQAGFAGLGLSERLLAAIGDLGFDQPTPIQRMSIPALVEGRDVLGLAATGTGKTAAYGLPLLQRLGTRSNKGVRALIVVPTRELARQVTDAIESFAVGTGIRVLAVYGGAPIPPQIRALTQGIEVVVATPGRAVDLMERNSLQLANVEVVVLDEADEMLDLGFQEDLEKLLDAVPETRQLALFSATFPDRLEAIAMRALKEPLLVEVPREDIGGKAPAIRQILHVVPRARKAEALSRILAREGKVRAIVFCRTRAEVEEFVIALDGVGTRAEALHGGLSQAQRDKVVASLRAGRSDLIVATDVAARGLDIPDLTHVINVDVPEVAEQYVHRIGRTGRAGKTGVAITLADPRDRMRVRLVERAIGRRLVPEPVPGPAEVRAARIGRAYDRIKACATTEAGVYADRAKELLEGHDPLLVVAAALRALDEAVSGGELEADPEPPRWVKLTVGIGKRVGVRSADLFGALVRTCNVPHDAIGAIRIDDRSSTVEINEDQVERVLKTFQGVTWGNKPVWIGRVEAGEA